MKHLIRISLFILLSVFLLSGCIGVNIAEDGLVMGSTYTLESGETQESDLTVIGGNATIEENATVEGDLAVMGGTVNIDGTIEGDVSVIGGYVSLGDTAVVEGDLSYVGGTIDRSPNAVVEGNETNTQPWSVTTMRTPPMQVTFDPIGGPLLAIFQALALGALAVLVSLFALGPLDRTGSTAVAQPIVSGGVGLLTIIIAPPLLLLVGITIILLPVSLLGILALGIAGLFGWLAIGLIVGRQVAVWLKQPWSDPVMAGVGTVVLSLVSSMLNLVPCLGWLANILIGLIGLGAVILTRFGTQMYPPYGTTQPAAYTPPATGARAYDAPAADDETVYSEDRPL